MRLSSIFNDFLRYRSTRKLSTKAFLVKRKHETYNKNWKMLKCVPLDGRRKNAKNTILPLCNLHNYSEIGKLKG